MICYVLLDVM